MDMSGEYKILASREQVWAALNDPAVLKECIPGCDNLEMISDTEMTAQVTAKVGPVKAKFKGAITLSDINPPESYKITGEGKGGVAGFAKGGAEVRLTKEGDFTILHYTANAQVGGKLAQLGSRLIDSTAKKMANDFFGNLADKLGQAEPDEKKEEDETLLEEIADIAEDVKETIVDAAHKVGDAVEHAEEALEEEASKNTLGGPIMWGLIALAVLIGGLLYSNS
ncbi:MAG: carbon monoxide dehydrogenase subunit G [Rhizobiales bacterium]|nr:carbon monoxide dehydrogenase subunit G [Hyphomicrobiales bacterium]